MSHISYNPILEKISRFISNKITQLRLKEFLVKFSLFPKENYQSASAHIRCHLWKIRVHNIRMSRNSRIFFSPRSCLFDAYSSTILGNSMMTLLYRYTCILVCVSEHRSYHMVNRRFILASQAITILPGGKILSLFLFLFIKMITPDNHHLHPQWRSHKLF